MNDPDPRLGQFTYTFKLLHFTFKKGIFKVYMAVSINSVRGITPQNHTGALIGNTPQNHARRLFKFPRGDCVTILAPEGALSQTDKSNHLMETALWLFGG